ncbi:MAG TPA: tyrosine-type recombinase/integrase [Candidatus Amulumruptor caecigallinarius]|uniref:Tyrosine-type recombinase/integrase n=1 Tax=Candidatus Amulumruptor caecigallinarius TaxID=2109911 RepID=A0A921E6D7_9BACT|nr:tyrosine-type recombinase/integrase [Candidatus Amulumruptor caecigallinarius]
MNSLISEFLNHLRHELRYSPRTVDAYEVHLSQWLDFRSVGEGLSVEDVLADDFSEVSVHDLRRWVLALGRRNLKPASIRLKVQSLRAFFGYLVDKHGRKSNPAAELILPKQSKRLPVHIRESEMKHVLDDEVDADDFIAVRDHLILLMLYTTGMRCSELISLEDGYVDTVRGELKVHGKRDKDRIIPFGAELAEAIDRYRQLRSETVGVSTTDTLFVRPDGRPLYRQLVWAVVNRSLDGRVHAARLSPHVVRHSCATDLLNHGADLTAVCQLLGHESLATTQIYTHLSHRDLQNIYQQAHPRAFNQKGE